MEGAPVDVLTARACARTVMELHEGSRRGHMSRPNGQGLDVMGAEGTLRWNASIEAAAPQARLPPETRNRPGLNACRRHRLFRTRI